MTTEQIQKEIKNVENTLGDLQKRLEESKDIKYTCRDLYVAHVVKGSFKGTKYILQYNTNPAYPERTWLWLDLNTDSIWSAHETAEEALQFVNRDPTINLTVCRSFPSLVKALNA